MLDTQNTNLEIYRDAIDIFEDIKSFDSCEWEERMPAVTATILYQLIDNKERRNKNETV